MFIVNDTCSMLAREYVFNSYSLFCKKRQQEFNVRLVICLLHVLIGRQETRWKHVFCNKCTFLPRVTCSTRSPDLLDLPKLKISSVNFSLVYPFFFKGLETLFPKILVKYCQRSRAGVPDQLFWIQETNLKLFNLLCTWTLNRNLQKKVKRKNQHI